MIDEEIEPWDVALEALIVEEYYKLGRTLHIGDFQRLSQQYAIRFDDMMYTAIELVLAGRWEYRDEESGVVITRVWFDELAANGRIEFADVRSMAGGWQPVDR